MSLRWKKAERETGLARIGAGPRSSYLWDGTQVYAHIHALGGDCRGPLQGWFWSRPGDELGPHINTAWNPVATEAEAKKQALDYIKSLLKDKKGV